MCESDSDTEQVTTSDCDQFDKILRYVEYGKQDGAKLVSGVSVGDKGYFVEPTLFTDEGRDANCQGRDLGPDEGLSSRLSDSMTPCCQRHHFGPLRRRVDSR